MAAGPPARPDFSGATIGWLARSFSTGGVYKPSLAASLTEDLDRCSPPCWRLLWLSRTRLSFRAAAITSVRGWKLFCSEASLWR